MPRIKRLHKLTGEISHRYDQNAIYQICILLNAVVDRVNYLVDRLEEAERSGKDADNGTG